MPEIQKLYIYKVDEAYIKYLKQFDPKVHNEYDNGRCKYVGVLITINGQHYYAPLSSPKPKHVHLKGKDLVKIKGGTLGVLNLNNMIPIPENALIKFNIDKEPDQQYKNVLFEQAAFINVPKNKESILNRSKKVYNLVTNGLKNGAKSPDVKRLIKRSCNFPLLEEKCKGYSQASKVDVSTEDIAALQADVSTDVDVS